MIIIGLTGSIGMGKSTVANMLRQDMNIPVCDADAIVHKLLARDGAGVAPVAAAFPGAVKKGEIDRKKLRALLGYDHSKWDKLEKILHPLVRVEQDKFIAMHRTMGAKMVVLDIPLLFETGGEARVDKTICVTAPASVQRQRVLARPGATEKDFLFRLSRQMPDVEKCRRADYIVHTGIGFPHTNQTLRKIIAELRGNQKAPRFRL